MVKHIRLTLDDEDFNELVRKKAFFGITWEQMLKRGGEIE